MQSGKFRVIDAEMRHLGTISDLFTAVGAPTACTPEFLLWNFKTPWAGEGQTLSMTLVVDEDERAVSCYGSMVTPLRFFGESRQFAWSGNYLTLPKYRNLGLGGSTFLTHMRKYEVYMAFSPNNMSWPMFRAARFINFPKNTFSRYIFPYDWDRMCSLLDCDCVIEALRRYRETLGGCSTQSDAGRRGYSFSVAEAFGADYDALWDACKDRFAVCTEKNARYMCWRYLDIPYFQYELRELRQHGVMVGMCVWRRQDFSGMRVARMCDFLASDGHEEVLLALAVEEVRRSGAVFMDFYETGSRLRNLFSRQGFIPAEGELCDIPSLFSPFTRRSWTNSLHVWVKRPEDRREELRDINSYYLTKGDADRDIPTMHHYRAMVSEPAVQECGLAPRDH